MFTVSNVAVTDFRSDFDREVQADPACRLNSTSIFIDFPVCLHVVSAIPSNATGQLSVANAGLWRVRLVAW